MAQMVADVLVGVQLCGGARGTGRRGEIFTSFHQFVGCWSLPARTSSWPLANNFATIPKMIAGLSGFGAMSFLLARMSQWPGLRRD